MRSEDVVNPLFQFMGQMFYDPSGAKLDIDTLPEEFRKLGKGLVFFASMLNEQRDFARELARGNFGALPPSPGNELAAPLKSLHASLKHLTWQTQRIANGDYKQRVDFMGDFAEAFNQMVVQLEERRVALLQEIEAGRKKTRALEQNVGMFKEITLNLPQWIVVLDTDTLEMLFVNRTASGVFEAEPLLAKSLLDWLNTQMARMKEQESRDRTSVLDTEILTRTRGWFLSVTAYPLIWRDRQAIAFIITDLSSEREHLHELENVAYQDALTGVTSRHYGLKKLNEWIEARLEFCICFVDMDNLKYVNDTFGHTAGDEYIICVANILGRFSGDALVCRLGGDEFMLLQKNQSETQTQARMQELQAELVETSLVHNISYGIVHVSGGNTKTASELLGAADERMYQFKRANKANRARN
jgi:diguanylate cyclase (GGDEF)-like protein